LKTLIAFTLHHHELLKLAIHDFDGLARSIHNRFQKRSGFHHRNLSLLLLLHRETLEGCIKVMFDLCIYLRHDILLFFSDQINEL